MTQWQETQPTLAATQWAAIDADRATDVVENSQQRRVELILPAIEINEQMLASNTLRRVLSNSGLSLGQREKLSPATKGGTHKSWHDPPPGDDPSVRNACGLI